MNNTVASRTLTGDSLGFHIIFAMVGVGLPLLILLAEAIALKTGKLDWYHDARRWTQALVILFIAGAISGTIISFQFSTLWAPLMKLLEPATGSAFFLEGIAFMIEAVFLAMYFLVWPKKPYIGHLLLGIPIVLASATSAFFITSANAFMNAPQGFDLVNGQVVNVHPWKALFNPATFTETSHSILAYYLATTCLLLTFYAWRYHKANADGHAGQRLVILAIVAFVLALGLGATGDASGKYLAKHEPAKLAVAEGLTQTRKQAPLVIGGVPAGDHFNYALVVPGALSFLATGNFNGVVVGLNQIAPPLRPPMVIHYFFDAMVGIGTMIPGILILFLAAWRFRRPWAEARPMLWLVAITGILATLAVEFGWLLTEIGRQPYAIRGVLFTNEAVTAGNLGQRYGAIFPMLYLVLFGLTGWALWLLIRPKQVKA